MKSIWKIKRISEIGTVVGGATPSTKNPSLYDGDIPWITPKDLSDHKGRYISHGERNITKEGYKSCSTQMLPAGSILFSSRAPIGYVAIASNEVCTNQGFKSIVPNKDTDNLFTYYLLLYNKKRIEAMGGGTTFKEVSGSVMKNIEVNVPDYPTQKKIGLFLGSFDDQIELNLNLIRNLESQIKIIFKEFSVRKTKKSKVGDLPILVTDYVANGSFASLKENVTLYDKPNYAYFIRNTDLKDSVFKVYVDKKSYDFLSKSSLFGDEIIISNVGDIGSVFLCPFLDKPMTLGNNVIVIKPNNEIVRYYLYCLFKWFDGQQLIQSIKGGSAVPKFNKTEFKNLVIDIISEKDLNDFDSLVRPLFSEIRYRKEQISKLSKIRDGLINDIMSRKIEIDSEED